MSGIELKQNTAPERALDLGRRLAASPAGRRAGEALGYAGAAFLLAALPLLGEAAPLAACLALCAGLWVRGTAALAGACAGYVLFWGWSAAMEPLALAMSCYAGALIFRRTPFSRAVLALTLQLAVGGLFLLDTGFGLLPLLRLALGSALAALLPPLLDRAAAEKPAGRMGAAALLLLALAAAAPLGRMAVLCGALLLPALDRLPLPAAETADSHAAAEPVPVPRAVEKALRSMHGVLAREDPLVPPVRLAEVYDFAADRVCRCCVRYALCWEQNAEDTYRDLCAAGEAILPRGVALREDLPERFAARCCHTAGFLTAVNHGLDEALVRRREDRRRLEGRRVAAGQYLALARLLDTLSRHRPGAVPRYSPELAVGAAGKAGSAVSGDRGAVCTDRFGRFYVLLCDGMGTGAPARSESDRAARLLTAFLETGLEADTALELVNGFYVLRRAAAFSTLDLLRLDLNTGEGVLYKWGAAPSYLRRGDTVEIIGTATPPPGLAAAAETGGTAAPSPGPGGAAEKRGTAAPSPGLDAAEGRVPGQYALSLREGETLVMVSDGAFGEETARRLTAFAQGSVRDLASCLITLGEQDAGDDRTAVVLRLKPIEGSGIRHREMQNAKCKMQNVKCKMQNAK